MVLRCCCRRFWPSRRAASPWPRPPTTPSSWSTPTGSRPHRRSSRPYWVSLGQPRRHTHRPRQRHTHPHPLGSCKGDSACLTPPERASDLLAPMWLRCDRHRSRSPRFLVTSLLGTPWNPPRQNRRLLLWRSRPQIPYPHVATLSQAHPATDPGESGQPPTRRFSAALT